MQRGGGSAEGMQIAESFRMPLYICYINETSPPGKMMDHSHFVLSGIAIPASHWKKYDSRISNIKTRFLPEETEEERRDFLKRICDEINVWTEARLFAEVLDRNALATCPASPDRLYEDALTQVISRFQAFLVNRGNYLGMPLYGLVVQANFGEVAVKSANVVRNPHRKGVPWKKFDKIVETMLVDIRSTSMVQIAAICGYATQRYFEHGESDLFDRIYKKFDRAKNTVVGIRHSPAEKCCYCRVCADRRLSAAKLEVDAPMAAGSHWRA